MTKKHAKYYLESDGEMLKVPTGKTKRVLFNTNTNEPLSLKPEIVMLFQNNLPSGIEFRDVKIYERVPIPGKWRPHRVLTPSEVDDLLMELKIEYQYLFKAILYTGCRYTEIERFLVKDPSIFYGFDKEFIKMPNYKSESKKKMGLTRTITLHQEGRKAVDALLKYMKKHPFNIPTAGEWVSILRRAAKRCDLPAKKGYKYVCEDGTNDWKEKKSKLIKEGMTPVQTKYELMKDNHNHQTLRLIDKDNPFKVCPICNSNKFKRIDDDWYDMSFDSHILRRTWENWLILSFPDCYGPITESMGHDKKTAKSHYIGGGMMSNTIVMAEIRSQTKNWGGLNGK